MITASKLEEAKSSRMTTPTPQPAKSPVSQVDHDVPHDRPVVWQALIKPSDRFRVSSSDGGNDFIRAVRLLRAARRTKHLHKTERLAGIRASVGDEPTPGDQSRCATTWSVSAMLDSDLIHCDS
jgi:hypothetical protein